MVIISLGHNCSIQLAISIRYDYFSSVFSWCKSHNLEKLINCIDNKMFGNERCNEVNARYMADHFWHELSYLQIHNQK